MQVFPHKHPQNPHKDTIIRLSHEGTIAAR